MLYAKMFPTKGRPVEINMCSRKIANIRIEGTLFSQKIALAKGKERTRLKTEYMQWRENYKKIA